MCTGDSQLQGDAIRTRTAYANAALDNTTVCKSNRSHDQREKLPKAHKCQVAPSDLVALQQQSVQPRCHTLSARQTTSQVDRRLHHYTNRRDSVQ